MWADGTMMSYGALLLELFHGHPHEYGTMSFSPEHIEAQIEATQRAGFDMHIHNDGDGSVRVILDAIERVQERLGRGPERHTVCHNPLVHPTDVGRFAELGVIANVTPLWGTDYSGTYIDIYTDLLGSDRVERESYPNGDLVRSGAVVTFGADIPGVLTEEIAPLMHVEAAVTRQRPGHAEDRTFVERQQMTLDQALHAMTINGAYQLRIDDQVGSLEVGKRADLVVLARNLFDLDPHDIHTTAVRMTMMDGRVTFESEGANPG
jgi:predicted amidohydrolase YtcJ